MSFLNFPDCAPFIYIRRRDFCSCRVKSEEREKVGVTESVETESVLFRGGLLLIIFSVTRIKGLID